MAYAATEETVSKRSLAEVVAQSTHMSDVMNATNETCDYLGSCAEKLVTPESLTFKLINISSSVQ